MKTELTKENWDKFKAQYYGQYVLMWDDGSIFFNVPEYWCEDDCLALKDLSSISDEDAMKVWEMTRVLENEAGYKTDWEELRDRIKEDGIAAISFFDFYTCYSDCVDLIRNLGYATGWMGLSVEEMIKDGRIKLIS